MAQLYYYYSEALEEARKLCEEINGYIPEQEVTVDDTTRFNYIDRRIHHGVAKPELSKYKMPTSAQ